ncbi:hypothetical protein BpHYR1_031451 [Brachionus plicatilis]|uniref:Uncharacterized protein n=1 Tax=Brachionus plicatilis TaxID=10195 RepID=A0A3M7PCF5_BRAPC|nr:hypothetical protein BpHYR1_031451 [Brachionus plicatilis]
MFYFVPTIKPEKSIKFLFLLMIDTSPDFSYELMEDGVSIIYSSDLIIESMVNLLRIVRHIIETSSRVLAVGIVAKFSKELLFWNIWFELELADDFSGNLFRKKVKDKPLDTNTDCTTKD